VPFETLSEQSGLIQGLKGIFLKSKLLEKMLTVPLRRLFSYMYLYLEIDRPYCCFIGVVFTDTALGFKE